MSKLVLAVAATQRHSAEESLNEATAGLWRNCVEVVELSANRAENDHEVRYLAEDPEVTVLAAAHLTSEWIEEPRVERLQKTGLMKRAMEWLGVRRLTWGAALKALTDLPGFKVPDEGSWRNQFKKVDPMIGPRVAKALLMQLRVVRSGELADMLLEGPPLHCNVWFQGSDPHSGDTAMVTPLAARIDGELVESQKMDTPPNGERVRLFADGAWSGGETEKRIKCLTAQCAKKKGSLGPSHTLVVSVGIMTARAASRFERRGRKLANQGKLRRLEISCDRARVLDPDAGPVMGLAFANEDINRYVDPKNAKAFYGFCLKVGECIQQGRPLGTDGIASTIAFEHSLPKAMLPLFMFGGGGVQVPAADGSMFDWKPLMVSKHIQKPAKDDASHHCEACPLSPKAKIADQPASAAQPAADAAAPKSAESE